MISARALGFLLLLGASAAPGSALAQEPGGAPAVAERAPSMVRLHFRPLRHKDVVQVLLPRGERQAGCAAPCTLDLAAGSVVHLVIEGREEEPAELVIPGDRGPELDVVVQPASIGPLAGGIVMVTTGTATALLGLLVLAVAHSVHDASGAEAAGLVLTGVGTVTAGGGLLWLLTRSHEPRANVRPSRTAAFLGDAELARPRAEGPPAPLRFGFSF